MTDKMTDEAGSKPLENAQHEMFSRAYAKRPNATEAAKQAGYSEKTAYSQGSRLLKDVEIQERISILQCEALEAAELTPNDIKRMLLEDRSFATAKGQCGPRTRATELLGKTFALFTDKFETTEAQKMDMGDLVKALAGDEDFCRLFDAARQNKESPTR